MTVALRGSRSFGGIYYEGLIFHEGLIMLMPASFEAECLALSRLPGSTAVGDGITSNTAMKSES